MLKRSLEYDASQSCVQIIDQRLLPAQTYIAELRSLVDFCRAITDMQVRGAPLIGVTAAYGLALELARDGSDENLQRASALLCEARPTAINLAWAVRRIVDAVSGIKPAQRARRALEEAEHIGEQDVAACRAIGDHGLGLLRGMRTSGPDQPLQIMTHCNAGWLAALEWGTALSPVYVAAEAGIDLHVWVSETRPRNQGAKLTAWELEQAGIPHTVIADNAAGYLMQLGRVDCCIVGSDRTVANGDVCNKVGTYLKALAAARHGIPFYVALPVSTIDWECESGDLIPIEERAPAELLCVDDSRQDAANLLLGNATSPAYNPAFDVTPAELVTALITERGVFAAEPNALARLRSQLINQ